MSSPQKQNLWGFKFLGGSSGGTMPPEAPSYVERRADHELYDALLGGEFCYVLTARQMGKSSLMVRTAARLREAAVAVRQLFSEAMLTPEAKRRRARLIEQVAAGSEEMSASIREISATMSKSKANAAEATGRVDAADQQSQKLNDATQAMGGIVDVGLRSPDTRCFGETWTSASTPYARFHLLKPARLSSVV